MICPKENKDAEAVSISEWMKKDKQANPSSSSILHKMLRNLAPDPRVFAEQQSKYYYVCCFPIRCFLFSLTK